MAKVLKQGEIYKYPRGTKVRIKDSVHIPLDALNYAHDWSDRMDKEYEHERRMCRAENSYQPEMTYRNGLLNGFKAGYRKALEDIKKQKENGSRL